MGNMRKIKSKCAGSDCGIYRTSGSPGNNFQHHIVLRRTQQSFGTAETIQRLNQKIYHAGRVSAGRHRAAENKRNFKGLRRDRRGFEVDIIDRRCWHGGFPPVGLLLLLSAWQPAYCSVRSAASDRLQEADGEWREG